MSFKNHRWGYRFVIGTVYKRFQKTIAVENIMAGSLFDKMDGLIQGVRHFALGITLAIVSIFVLFFVGMTVIRLFGLCWRLLFSRPFGV